MNNINVNERPLFVDNEGTSFFVPTVEEMDYIDEMRMQELWEEIADMDLEELMAELEIK